MVVEPGPADENTDIDEIRVTATPIIEGTEITRYADKVDVVTDRQIDDLNAQDLATALYRVPGVMMSRHNVTGAYGGGDGGAIFIRGHGSSRPGQEIGTLIDGIPRFSGIWTHSLLDMLPVDMAGEIEVFKSAQPVLFGNMSFGAVNIVPKRLSADGSEGHVLMSYGMWNTWVASFEYGVAEGPFDCYFMGSHRNSDGHRDDSRGTVDSLYGRAGYRLNDLWQASFQVHHTAGSVDDPQGESVPELPMTERFITNSTLSILTFAHAAPKAEGSVKVYYDDGLQDLEEWDDILLETYSGQTDYANYGVRVAEKLFPWNNGEILLGLDNDFYGGHFVEKRESGDLYDTDLTFYNIAPYAMLSHVFGDDAQLIPSAGIRYNVSRYYEDQWGYQGGLKYERRGVTVYGNCAHSFNLPGVYTAILFGGAGWDTLLPEEIDHWEVGLEQTVSEKFSYNVAYFEDDVENALRVTFPGPVYENVGAYTSRGVELGFNVRPGRDLDIFFGGAYSDTDPSDSPYAPEVTLTAGVNYSFAERWRVSLVLQHVAEYYTGNPRTPAPNVLVGDYTILNMKLSCRIGMPDTGGEGEVFLAVENLANVDYELKPDYPMPGTTVMAGFEIGF
ncbi:MAG: TonB-dependent receptor plug domain-containing protein [Planctomycetes bacterium]|nr:TonB-dependent receptor plug domain-containing protein [Planctomycetota bacterium]